MLNLIPPFFFFLSRWNLASACMWKNAAFKLLYSRHMSGRLELRLKKTFPPPLTAPSPHYRKTKKKKRSYLSVIPRYQHICPAASEQSKINLGVLDKQTRPGSQLLPDKDFGWADSQAEPLDGHRFYDRAHITGASLWKSYNLRGAKCISGKLRAYLAF